MRFNIPEEDLQNIKKLADLENKKLKRIEEALKKESPTVDLKLLTASVVKSTSIDSKLVNSIITILWQFAIIKKKIDLTATDFVNSLITSLNETKSDYWDKKDTENLKKKVDHIINILDSKNSIAYSAKSAELVLDQQFLFCESRMITDIRPVFDQEAKDIECLIPFHILSISYHDDSGYHQIRFAMDINDILQLRKQLDGAEQKEKQIREIMGKKGLKIIGGDF